MIFLARISLFIFFSLLAVALNSCGSALKDFNCKSQDFERVNQYVTKHLGDVGKIHRSSSSAFSTVKEINEALWDKCPTKVLQNCKAYLQPKEHKQSLVGPINAFGITASYDVKMRYRRDADGGRVQDPEITYSISGTDSQKYHKATACFIKETK